MSSEEVTMVLVPLGILIFIVTMIILFQWWKKREKRWKEKRESSIKELGKISEKRRLTEKVDYSKVLIAHYDTGNVEDPLGVLHDEKGEAILSWQEVIISKLDNVRYTVSKFSNPNKWSGLADPTFNDAGFGTLYRTNKRLIYIREPNPRKQGASWVSGIRHQSGAIKWLQKGRNECVSLPLSRVARCNKHRKSVGLYVQGDNKRYRMIINIKISFPSEFWEGL